MLYWKATIYLLFNIPLCYALSSLMLNLAKANGYFYPDHGSTLFTLLFMMGLLIDLLFMKLLKIFKPAVILLSFIEVSLFFFLLFLIEGN